MSAHANGMMMGNDTLCSKGAHMPVSTAGRLRSFQDRPNTQHNTTRHESPTMQHDKEDSKMSSYCPPRARSILEQSTAVTNPSVA